MAVDTRYESVTVERRPGGWSLIAVRRATADAREHAQVRAALNVA